MTIVYSEVCQRYEWEIPEETAESLSSLWPGIKGEKYKAVHKDRNRLEWLIKEIEDLQAKEAAISKRWHNEERRIRLICISGLALLAPVIILGDTISLALGINYWLFSTIAMILGLYLLLGLFRLSVGFPLIGVGLPLIGMTSTDEIMLQLALENVRLVNTIKSDFSA